MKYFIKVIPFEYLKQDIKQYKNIPYDIISYDQINFELKFTLDINKHFRVDRINITIKEDTTINNNYG